MKQSEMLATLKELHSDLLRYAAGSDSIVPGAYEEALDAAIETLERIRWTSVKDGLPKNNHPVLVYMPELFSNIQVAFYDRYYGEDDDEWYEGWSTKMTMTHWMPLPEPPKGENDG